MTFKSSGSPESQMPMASPSGPTLDTFLKRLGDPGRYQMIVMLLLATNYIPVVTNHLLMAFYTTKAPHNCRVPEGGDHEVYLPPLYEEDGDNSSTKWEQCSMYKDPANHSTGTVPCLQGYEFHFSNTEEWTIVAEWGLVCERAFLAPLITTTYFCGVMIGGLIFGSLSDRFGRKSMMLICLYTQCIIGIALHFVRRLLVFMGLRFIQGIFIQGLQCVTYSMVMELVSPGWRTLAGCLVEAFWALGIMMLATIGKFVQHWRYIQLAINIPTIATIFYIWIIPESVRWLLSRGKVKRAESVVSSMVAYNSLNLDPAHLRMEMEAVSRGLMAKQDARRPPDITDILRVSSIRGRSFVLFLIWFSVSLCYYGISYYVPNLSGDKYLNFIIGGGIELAAYMIAFLVLGGFGRKVPLCVYLILSGLLCLSVISVRSWAPEHLLDVPALVTGLALMGKACVVSCFCTIFIYSSELFPTVIRTAGIGCCTFCGRLGSLLAPQILLVGNYIYADNPSLIPFLIFGGLCFFSALLTFLLPETLDQDLSDTIDCASVNAGGGLGPGVLDPGSRQGSQDSLDAGYGKCPEFVLVDGLIVSRDQDSRRDTDSGHGDNGGSVSSLTGTLTTLRSRASTVSTRNQHDYETIPARKDALSLQLRSDMNLYTLDPTKDNPLYSLTDATPFSQHDILNSDYPLSQHDILNSDYPHDGLHPSHLLHQVLNNGISSPRDPRESTNIKSPSHSRHSSSFPGQSPSYSGIMRDNEVLLHSHIALLQRAGTIQEDQIQSSRGSSITLVPDIGDDVSQYGSEDASASQDESVVSAQHSLVYPHDTKDTENLTGFFRQKLLLSDADETRL